MSRISAFLLVVLFFLLSSPFFSVRGCPPHELKALLRFRSTIFDDDGMLGSWKGDDCCDWARVGCQGTGEGRHVSKLALEGVTLCGMLDDGPDMKAKIDSSLFELKHLNYLGLEINGFSGEIPSQLGNLSSLHHLGLFYRPYLYFPGSTNLTSSNLHWLSSLSSLEYLSLSGVNVSDKSWGAIIGSLLHLKHLDLSYCSLPAPTNPSALLNLSSLTFLDLCSNSISDVSTWIGNLTSLEYLVLSDNVLSGQIPSSLGLLINLTFLDMGGNQLSGPIPSFIGNLLALEELHLDANKLQGNIPLSLGNLHKLATLDLSNNKLSGSLPLSFSKLFSLTHLDLNDNSLSGSLPLLFSKLFSLSYLDVSENRLNGSIPSAFMLPSSLGVLSLSYNSMNGTITEAVFQRSLQLYSLDLSQSGLSVNISSTWIPSLQLSFLRFKKCQIGGPIPSWISTQFWLSRLDLSDNQLVGNLPSWLWDIDVVQLSGNHLEGSFTPTSSGSSRNRWSTRYLDLSMNELSGRLPTDIHVHLPNAEVLILSDNKFEGQIPHSIANLRNLQFLGMSINCLKGTIPAALGSLTKLEALNLETNHLEGDIPKELGSLFDLLSLRIGKNSLQGVLPSSFTNFSHLQVLDVGVNNLTGNMPHWIANISSLHVLVMRSNNFRGRLPPEIGQMPELKVLDLSSNLFSGMIPHSYLRFPAMQNYAADGELFFIFTTYQRFYSSIDLSDSLDLTVKGQELHYEYVLSSLASFDLSNNRLSGPLLPEIDNLKGLIFLNLSMNNLSGPIPESLGNLVQLESIDLSFNNFSGQIPWNIGNLTSLAHLNLSYNNLCGRIPEQGGQMLTFDESSYKGNPNLSGCPLQRNCPRRVARASPPAAVGVEEKRQEAFEFPWFEMCFGLAVGSGFSGVVILLVLQLSWRKKCFDAMDRVIEEMDRVICKLPMLKLKPKPMGG